MSNAAQIAYWNNVAGPKWVRVGDMMDARFAEITAALLRAAEVRPGERVLEIGCGTGSVAAMLADAGGRVTGIDIAAPMLEVARARAPEVEFLQADAAAFDFEDRRFECLVSRFGVMFFNDPVAAFANLRATLVADGRLCFACWAPLAGNPHWAIPFDIVSRALGPPSAKPPGAPGPMAFADPTHVTAILRAAGYSEISIAALPVSIIGKTLQEETEIAGYLGPAGALLDEKSADAATRRRLASEIARAIRPFETLSGLALPATVFMVTARR